MHTHINVGVKFKTILDISIKQNVNEQKNPYDWSFYKSYEK